MARRLDGDRPRAAARARCHRRGLCRADRRLPAQQQASTPGPPPRLRRRRRSRRPRPPRRRPLRRWPADDAAHPDQQAADLPGQGSVERLHAGLAGHADAPGRAPSTGAGTGTSTGAGTGTGTGTSGLDARQHDDEPADTGPQPIELNGDAARVYDPYGGVKASARRRGRSTPTPTTSWYVDPKDPAQIAVGYRSTSASSRACARSSCRRRRRASASRSTPPTGQSCRRITDTRRSHIKDVATSAPRTTASRRSCSAPARAVPQRAALVHPAAHRRAAPTPHRAQAARLSARHLSLHPTPQEAPCPRP